MKKALIIATVYPFINHFEKNNIKILQELGYEVHTIASGDDMIFHLDVLNVKKNIINITRNPISIANIKAYFFIKKYINDNKIDLVHCHTPVGGVLGRLCNRKRRKKGKSKTIYTAHGFHFYKGAPLLNWLVYYPIEKWLSKYTDVLITINTEDYNRAKDKFKMKQLEYIPGVGVDISKFQLKNFNRDEYRNKLGLQSDDFAILSVGELNKNKNHEVIVRAIAKLKNKKIHYFIAGVGPLEKYIKDLSKKLDIADRIHLLGFRKDIAELNQSMDVFAFPSIREGLGLAAIEAMAAGLPLITSNTGGINDYSENKITGFKCKSNDIQQFSKNIDYIMNNDDFRNRCSRECIDRSKKFCLHNSENIIEMIYEQIIR